MKRTLRRHFRRRRRRIRGKEEEEIWEAECVSQREGVREGNGEDTRNGGGEGEAEGEEGEGEPSSDPAHWYDDEDAAAYCTSAYYTDEAAWPDEVWDEFHAYAAKEWALKDSEDLRDSCHVDDAKEAAELDCVVCMFDALGPDCLDNLERCASFVQEGATAFLAFGKGKGKSKGKGKGKAKYQCVHQTFPSKIAGRSFRS